MEEVRGAHSYGVKHCDHPRLCFGVTTAVFSFGDDSVQSGTPKRNEARTGGKSAGWVSEQTVGKTAALGAGQAKTNGDDASRPMDAKGKSGWKKGPAHTPSKKQVGGVGYSHAHSHAHILVLTPTPTIYYQAAAGG
jgi:hypothetical protein